MCSSDLQQQRIVTANLLPVDAGAAGVASTTTTRTFPSISSASEFMARLKMEPGLATTTATLQQQQTGASGAGGMIPASTSGPGGGGGAGGSVDCYEDMFKVITKKLYGEEGLPEAIDAGAVGVGVGVGGANQLVYDHDIFRSDGLTLVTTGNGLPPGTIVLQRRLQDDKGQ